jgi:PAS domain-containing protein
MRAQEAFAGRPIYARMLEAGRFEEIRIQDGLRVLLAVPVLHEGALLCVVNAASHSLDEFPTAVQAALEALARQAGSALARIQAESALRQGHADLQGLFDSVDDLLFIMDGSGRIVQTNRAAEDHVDELPGDANRALAGENHHWRARTPER